MAKTNEEIFNQLNYLLYQYMKIFSVECFENSILYILNLNILINYKHW